MKTHKEQVIDELNSLYDPNFKIPPGLYIPLGQRVLVKEIVQPEKKTAAGILLPSAAKLEHARIGVVYRIGEGVTMPIKVGMTVAYDKNVYMGIIHDGTQYTDLMEHQIFSVVPPDNYLAPHVADNNEKRRADRIDSQKKYTKKVNSKMDEIQNG